MLNKYWDASYTIPPDVLDGYPLHLRQLLPDVVGRRIPFIKKGSNNGRQIFLTFFPRPPWHCELCGEPIYWTGRGGDCLHVHHENEDREDNRLINLVPAHGSCHVSFHKRKRSKR